MCILTRRIGESLMIGDDTQVAVLGVKGNQVRIGITAPQGVNVVREELLDDPFANQTRLIERQSQEKSGNLMIAAKPVNTA